MGPGSRRSAGRPLDGSYTYDTIASNVHVYILDTGMRAHEDCGGRVTNGYDVIDAVTDSDDCHGHGIHVAGTVGSATWGVAKAVRIVGVRVLNCAGSGTWSGVAAGIDWVTANAVKPAVANVSLGGGASSIVDSAVQNSMPSASPTGERNDLVRLDRRRQEQEPVLHLTAGASSAGNGDRLGDLPGSA